MKGLVLGVIKEYSLNDIIKDKKCFIHISSSGNKVYELRKDDEIWVSADSFEEHWLKPGTVLVAEKYDGYLVNYKLNPGCYFLVKSITYGCKPKWWQFWKKPEITGYVLKVWNSFGGKYGVDN